MGWMTAAAIVGSSLIGADAAGDAAGAQASASAASTAAQERMFNKQVELQEPWRQSGQTALNRLNYLLGLDTAKTYDQYREELLPQYTTKTSGSTGSKYPSRVQAFIGRSLADTGMSALDIAKASGVDLNNLAQMQPQLQRTLLGGYTLAELNGGGGGGGGQSIDEAALDAAIRARMSEDANAPKGADYGKYARDFGMSDFEADPGYAFRLSEGQKALDRSAAARGGLISGSALKAATRYGQDMGSQEYTNAFNRYQTNRANQLQPLQSLSGVGQTSANTLSNAAANLGSAIGANEINAGNARASGYVGQASALNQGLSTYLNYNQNQNMMNMLAQNRGGTPTGYGTNLGVSYGTQA